MDSRVRYDLVIFSVPGFGVITTGAAWIGE
jgi:hypothetical protein